MSIPISASGRSTVFIKAAVDRCIAGHNYKAGELIAILNDVEVNILYKNLSKIATSKVNLVVSSEFCPDIIEIQGKTLSQGIMEVLFGKKLNSSEQKIPFVYTDYTDGNGSIELKHIDIFELFIIDAETKEKLNYSIDESGLIEGLPEDREVLVSYYYKQESEFAFQLEKSQSPLVRIEVVNEININGRGRKQLITIDKAALYTQPNFSFFRDSITSIPLGFSIIDGVMKIAYF